MYTQKDYERGERMVGCGIVGTFILTGIVVVVVCGVLIAGTVLAWKRWG